jgi:hypothetical protein
LVSGSGPPSRGNSGPSGRRISGAAGLWDQMTARADDQSAEWTAELESTGRVVFPQRRRRLLVQMAIFGLFAADSLRSLVSDVRDGEMVGVWAVLRVTSTTMFLVAAGFTVWQLVTRPL